MHKDLYTGMLIIIWFPKGKFMSNPYKVQSNFNREINYDNQRMGYYAAIKNHIFQDDWMTLKM